jgi:DNA-binding XRE family transcriptional regulator
VDAVEKIGVYICPAKVYILYTMTGQELKRARLALNMTQKGLGEALGLAKNHVALMERGEQPVRKVTELAIKYLLVMSKKRERKKSR